MGSTNKVTWTRPVDERTSLRFFVSSLLFRNRDFSCVCRTGKIKTRNIAEPECYVHALTSVPEAVMSMSLGLPEMSGLHGTIYTSGLIVEDIGKNRCLVSVIADVDFAVATRAFGDREVRHHTHDVAHCLKTML